MCLGGGGVGCCTVHMFPMTDNSKGRGQEWTYMEFLNFFYPYAMFLLRVCVCVCVCVCVKERERERLS